MQQPKDFPMGRSDQIRYARNVFAVAVLIAAVVYSAYSLCVMFLNAAGPMP